MLLRLFACLVFTCTIYVNLTLSQEKESYTPELTGPYLGQKPPGNTPEVFATGIISTSSTEFSNTFTPDIDEFYFTRISDNSGKACIMFTKLIDGKWTKPDITSFSGTYNDFDALMSPDGNRLYYCSNRSLEKNGNPEKHYDILYVEKTDSGWSEPVSVGGPVNSTANEYYPSIANNGNFYFFSDRSGGMGKGDFYVSKFLNGHYQTPENLGEAVNTKHREGDAFITPNEKYLIFSAFVPGNFGSGDLYISYLQEDGKWSKAKNMGNVINSNGNEFTPLITPDGKYLFFASDRTGNDEIYWVDARIIEDLKSSEKR